MTNYVIVNDGTDYGNKTGRIASVVQGEVGKVLLIDVQDAAGNDFSITNATSFVGRMETPAGAVTTVTGTITVSGGGISWEMSSGDVGTPGRFSFLVQFTLNGDIYKTHPVTLNIIADPAATEVQGDTNVTIPQSEATWLTAEKTAIEAAADGNLLQSDGTNSEDSLIPTNTVLVDGDIGVTIQAFSAKTAAIAALTWAANNIILLTGTATASVQALAAHVVTFIQSATAGDARTAIGAGDTATHIVIAASDETTNLTTGLAKVTFRMPYAMTLTEVRANVNTAPVGSAIQVDINKSSGTILSTKITIDAGDETSEDATTPPVISDTALADDAELIIDIDAVGSSTAGKGLKVTLIGTRP